MKSYIIAQNFVIQSHLTLNDLHPPKNELVSTTINF